MEYKFSLSWTQLRQSSCAGVDSHRGAELWGVAAYMGREAALFFISLKNLVYDVMTRAYRKVGDEFGELLKEVTRLRLNVPKRTEV